MKRELTDHQVGGLNEELHVGVLDEPGAGNACHKYVIFHPHDAVNQELNASMQQHVLFQNGPIGEAGVNGVSNEALLAVLIDRMRGFQSGPYACRENAIALTHMEDAMHWLQHRTRDRLKRSVEGTHEK